ncbi:hypothetical protein ACM8AR_21725 [Pseudomonas aeruginosa]|uniref:hypothetical protein n=1 Tax=Pseudomonas aeruginosa TaxID=287 RepID=UPI0018C7F80E|nr:hypothetical protein [Pseudomonas aeruginosa]EKQ6319226.1 hypothetical protein [Pseudomonas aeruginosa]MBG4162175.1 hypothetical protein [Pseudomonas aeruginosa]MBG4198270.1 hypothetical protein [Pseudomonas aeruginosa]MDY1279636.1 hypothetical protein [Pseudomonas aeruginosa]HCK4353452.1 hypothetical protein [Pseudomonas aeruginosa]
MMKVDVLYLKSGKTVSMEKRYADILSKLGHVLVVEPVQAGTKAEIITTESNIAQEEQPRRRGRRPRTQQESTEE